MRPLLVSSGEPAGIGPDLCLALAGSELPIVILCDKILLAARAKQLGRSIVFLDYQPGIPPVSGPDHLTVLSVPSATGVVAGNLDSRNAAYVIQLLTMAMDRCLQGEFSALITAPVNKAVINQAGIAFTGHTEFFADYCQSSQVVMMLACSAMKVALITTHMPLRQVADAINAPLIVSIISQLNLSLQNDFGLARPKIFVAGLNPHAGEMGYLGTEELGVITPAIQALTQRGIDVRGPYPADTMFTPHQATLCDAFVAMYHDQGLPVLKYAGFGEAVNITLGLPIIRTSVDHGTALDLAGTGRADPGSLLAAVNMAASIVEQRVSMNNDHD